MFPAGEHQGRGVQGALAECGTGRVEVAVELVGLSDGVKDLSITAHLMFGDEIVDKERNKSMTDKTIEALRALGWEGDDLSNLTGIDKNLVRFGVKHEEHQGVTRAKVNWIGRAGGLAVRNRLTGDALASFSAKMKGKILASKKSAGAPVEQQKDTAIRDADGNILF